MGGNVKRLQGGNNRAGGESQACSGILHFSDEECHLVLFLFSRSSLLFMVHRYPDSAYSVPFPQWLSLNLSLQWISVCDRHNKALLLFLLYCVPTLHPSWTQTLPFSLRHSDISSADSSVIVLQTCVASSQGRSSYSIDKIHKKKSEKEGEQTAGNLNEDREEGYFKAVCPFSCLGVLLSGPDVYSDHETYSLLISNKTTCYSFLVVL